MTDGSLKPRIVLDEKPVSNLREAILRPLAEYNESKVGQFYLGPVAIFLRHPADDAIIGGLWGAYIHDWLAVDMLFVPEEFRGRGIGSTLMRMAEDVAQKRECVGIRVDTATYQAPGFYEKLGYQELARLKYHGQIHEQIYYFKIL
jgi:GNAT superfamily N-acetyltransferase